MLRDLRVKIRTRYSRISSCGYEEFLPLSKQFFAFLTATRLLRAVVSELLARNPDSVSEVHIVGPGAQVYGETAEKAAAIAHTKWQMFASQADQGQFVRQLPPFGDTDEMLRRYRDWYVEPLFDYLDEVLEDRNFILATLERYKHKVEWYRRDDLLAVYSEDTAHGESKLAKNMYEFLFDQGLPFQVEPVSASGRPDVVSLDDEHPFIGEVKIFDPEGSRGAAYIKKSFHQVYRYCNDHNEAVGYVIVFNVSKKQLRAELSSGADGAPRFEYNHRTIFLTVIDIHKYEGTASTIGVPETVTIKAEDMIREIGQDTSHAIDQ